MAERNYLKIGQEGDPNNLLTQGAPTWADAAAWHGQNLADTVRAMKQPETWTEAAGQYANALLMGTTAPGMRGAASPAFAKWFGKSKVVDEAGKPLVLYHGSGRDIAQFDPSQASQATKNVTTPWGHFFTPDPAEASRYATQFHGEGQNITPVHVAIENPYEMTRSEWDKHAMTVFRGQRTQEEAMADALDFKAKLAEAGHDGIIIKGRGFNNEYVAFEPTQIKSAIGNRGTFSPTDPRLTYGAAGLAAGATAAGARQ